MRPVRWYDTVAGLIIVTIIAGFGGLIVATFIFSVVTVLR
jgi:hypothetical protein